MESAAAFAKRVSWAELFFDLVFVFGVDEVSGHLREDHPWAGILRSVILLVPIYWSWVGMSVHANIRDTDNVGDRIGILAASLCSLFMGLATPLAYQNRGVLFGGAYLALRIVLGVLVFRDRPFVVNPFSIAVLVTGPLMVAGGLAPPLARMIIWGGAGAIDLATPALTRRRLVGVPFDPDHLPERFGTLMIIAIGEPILTIGAQAASEPHLGLAALAAVAATFVLACALWWVYFTFAADMLTDALRGSAARPELIRQVFSYGHLPFIGSIIAMTVGMAQAVAHPRDAFTAPVAALLFGGCALYFATFCYTHWRIFGGILRRYLVIPVVALAVIPAAPRVPSLAAVLALLMAVAGFNILEHTRGPARIDSDSRTDRPVEGKTPR